MNHKFYRSEWFELISFHSMSDKNFYVIKNLSKKKTEKTSTRVQKDNNFLHAVPFFWPSVRVPLSIWGGGLTIC
jgi:hypothetical protein